MNADVVFRGGRVFTADRQCPVAGAVAIAGGRIVAVDPSWSRTALAERVGPCTEVVDLGGRMLLPGFVDAHVHAVYAGLEMARCALNDLDRKEQYLAAIAGYAAAQPDLTWIKGGGWRLSPFGTEGPTAADLDRAVGPRPAFLWSKDGHLGWASSAAIARAGVTASTPDPPGGRIGRLPDGSPSGMFYEDAKDLILDVMPSSTPAQVSAALASAQRRLNAVGITGWQDPIICRDGGLSDPAEAYRDFALAGTLSGRVVGALWWDRHRGPEQLDELRAARRRLTVGRLTASAVKVMQDGIVEACTAALLEPYLDMVHDHGSGRLGGSGDANDSGGAGAVADGGADHGCGTALLDDERLTAAIVALDAAGFDVHVHAIGDRAVRRALDAVAAALARNGCRDHRHQLAHVQVVADSDVGRFAELGVIANVQPYLATRQQLMVERMIPLLGARRAARQYRFADLVAAGAVLAGGSDWPVTIPDPLAGIHVAVNRTMVPGHRGAGAAPLFAEQALTLEQALYAYTVDAASACRFDRIVDPDDPTAPMRECGRIRVGADADLVVLDRDLFAVPADELGTVTVEQTFIAGRRAPAPSA